MFRRGNPFVRVREETSSTRGVSRLCAGLSLSWPSHIHIQPNLLKSCHGPNSTTFQLWLLWDLRQATCHKQAKELNCS